MSSIRGEVDIKIYQAQTLSLMFVGLFSFGLATRDADSASASPAITRTQQEAEANGHFFAVSHDEIGSGNFLGTDL